MADVAYADRFNRTFQALDALAQKSARLRTALDASRELERMSAWFPERRAGGERRDFVERRRRDRRVDEAPARA